MSFQLSKDSNGKPIKKPIIRGTTLNSILSSTPFLSSANSILVNNNNFEPSMPVITSTISTGPGTTTQITGVLDQQILNKTSNLTAGTASAGKVLTLDNNKNISGVNVLKLNSIKVNDVNIVTEIADPSSVVVANDYFSNNVPGVATAGKCLVADSNLNASVNKLSGSVSDSLSVLSPEYRNIRISLAKYSNLSNNKWIDIIYSVDLTKFLAYGVGIIATSSSGDTWTEYSKPTISFKKIRWVPSIGKYIGCTSTDVLESSDGIDWTVSMSSTNIVSIAVGNAKVLAVNNNTIFSKDLNSTTWTGTAMTTAMSAITWNNLTFGSSNINGDIFVLVGENNISSCLETGVSVNTNWTTTSLAGSWGSVAFGNDIFIATNRANVTSNKITMSTNGNAWYYGNNTFRSIETGMETSGLASVKFLSFLNIFIILPTISSNYFLHTKAGDEFYYNKYSSNGILTGVSYSPIGKKVVGITSSKSLEGDIGDFGALQPIQIPLRYMKNDMSDYTGFSSFCSFDNTPVSNLVFACNNNGLLYSSDGINFNKCNLTVNGENLFDKATVNVIVMTYASHISKFIATCAPTMQNGYVNGIISSDGINWQIIVIENNTQVYNFITYSPATNKIYALRYSALSISSDGITWTTQSYIAGERISIVDDKVILHGNHGGKRYHFLNANLTYTPIDFAIGSLSVFTKFTTNSGSAHYAFSGSVVYKSLDNGVNWTVENNFGSSLVNMILHKELNRLVIYTSNNKVLSLNSAGVWTTSDMLNFAPGYFYNICYSDTYKCIYTSQSNIFRIYRTAPLVSECLSTSNVFGDTKIYRTLPNFSIHNREMDDNLITGIKYNTTLRTLPTTTEGYREIFYSRKANKLYALNRYVADINPSTVESTNNFFTNSATVKYSILADCNVGMLALICSAVSSGSSTSSNSNIQLYNKTLGTTTSTTSNWHTAVNTTYTTNSGTTANIIKYCNEIRSLYRASGNSIILYYMTLSSSTYNAVSETFTFSSAPSLTACALSKELNLAIGVASSSVVALNMKTNTVNNSVNLAGKTLVNVEYHYNAKMFIIVATNAIYYSVNGSTVLQSPTSALSNYTYTYCSIKYIPELNVMGLVSTNMFAFSRNGIDWTVIPTTVQKAWVSFDYNAIAGTIVLMSQAGDVLISSPVVANLDNTLCATNAYMSKDKLSIGDRSRIHVHHKNDSALNASGLALRCNSKNFYIDNQTDLRIYNDANVVLNVSKTDPLANPNNTFKLNGTTFSPSANVFNSILLAKPQESMEYIPKSSLKYVEMGGSLSFKDVSTGALEITNSAISGSNYGDMGLVVADSKKNVSITKLGVSSIVVGNTTISPSTNTHPLLGASVIKESPFMSIDKYMAFKNTNYMNGTATVIGSAYSPDLDTIVIVAGAQSTQITNYIATSNDKGKSWRNYGISSFYGIGVDADVYTCKLRWFSESSSFMLVLNNYIMVSSDGYNWIPKPVSFGSNPSIVLDTKLNRITVVANNRIAYPADSTNLLGTWVVPSDYKTVRMYAYFQPLDLYFFRDASDSIVKHTADIYTSTITSTNTTTISLISDMVVWNDWLYYVSSNNIYRRNTAGTGNGDIIFTHASITFRRLAIVQDMNILVAFSNRSFVYTSNGITWNHISYSNFHAPSHADKTIEGVMNNIFWAKDRLMMLLSSNGSLLESALEETTGKTPIQYIDSLINNRLSSDRLLANTKGLDTIVRHSNTPVNTYATAYGNGFFVTTGDDVNFISNSLKKNQSPVAHVGQWRDIVYHKLSGQFIKVGADIMSTSAMATSEDTWNDITPPTGQWDTLLSIGNKVIIFYASVGSTPAGCKIATVDNVNLLTSATVWVDVPLSNIITKWNGIEVINDIVILLGTNYVSYKSFNQITNGTIQWEDKYLYGNWNDVAYGKGMYVFAGDALVGRSKDLQKFYSVKIHKNYHRVIYVRLLSEFFLMNKGLNNFSNSIIKDNTDAVVRTFDGTQIISSMNSFLHATTVTTARPYYLSNMYYFENVDQFAFPLNNSQNKYYIFTMPYAVKASNYKTVVPETFTTNADGTTLEIARGNNVISAPATFNVFQDSAAKPATSTWITTSDERLKEDIQPADLNICLNNVKNLDLKYFKWKDDYIGNEITTDRRKLGWIAQEVEAVIPKAVKKKNMFNMEDCRVLNSDQIIANMFGAVKMLIKKIKEKEELLNKDN